MTGTVRIVYGRRPGCPGTAHGTERAYHRYGCRCAGAREEYLRHQRQWRARHPRTGLGVPPRRGVDVDEIAVDLACLGPASRDLLRSLSQTERTLAVARLRDAGLSGRATAARLGLCVRTVQRYRARARRYEAEED